MIHKIKNAYPLDNYLLNVHFVEGVIKSYDLKPLISKFDSFTALIDKELFVRVVVDVGGYGISWNEDLDLSCDELWLHGSTIATEFAGLLAISDATRLWNLNESTLRKAIAYGKLIPGIDTCKFGKQWLVTFKAMEREYGLPM